MLIKMRRPIIAFCLFATLLAVFQFVSCKKNDPPNNNPVSSHSSDVLDKWLLMQIRLMKNATGIPNQALSRQYAYSGIAALESVSPGLTGYSRWRNKWNGLTVLPNPEHSSNYFYPANVNAAMASINRSMFPNASETDKLAIDSLENALFQSFTTNQPALKLERSSNFGKAVALAVFNWSETDNFKHSNAPYTIPVGPGLWKPTPPAFAPPASPYYGNNRPVVKGSLNNVEPPSPIPYSTDPTSPFYQMAKEVYDASLVLTDDQKAMAAFWRDVPGATSPGHWLSILQQVIRKENSRLDKAALAYALTGAAMNDGAISCWKTKYQYNVVRPITYIREVMGHATWNAYLNTPAHPDYSSGHSVLSGAAAIAFKELFGNIGSFTDHTYDYLGYAPRTYSSFWAIAEEAARSRLYAGIHYQYALNQGLTQGKKVGENIFKHIQFGY